MWTDVYHRKAVNEGWWLSTRSDGFYEIQRLDESVVFASDQEALTHVNARAAAGSRVHQTALRLHGTEIRDGWR